MWLGPIFHLVLCHLKHVPCHQGLLHLDLVLVYAWIIYHNDCILKFVETIKHAHESLRDGPCATGFCTSLSYFFTSCATPSSSYQSQYNDVSWLSTTKQIIPYYLGWRSASCPNNFVLSMGLQQ